MVIHAGILDQCLGHVIVLRSRYVPMRKVCSRRYTVHKHRGLRL
jgi:hypothetical protein